MTETYFAETLAQFMKSIDRIEKACKPKKAYEPELWYRGAQKCDWKLVPKLYRCNFRVSKLLEIEDEVREEFVRRGPSLSRYRPENQWEWYFLMQHYGAPTRLLDWTESPQVALYFAVKDSESLHDAAVWVLDPWQLNKKVVNRYEVLPTGAPGLSTPDARRYKPWLPDRFDAKQRLKKEYPVAVFPNQFDLRIAAQRSCFTVHGLRKESLDKLIPRKKMLLFKILIPSHAVEKMRKELKRNGLDETTIYPDLEGLGKCVSRTWLPEVKEIVHDGLCTELRRSPIHGVGVFAIRPIKKGSLIFPGDSDEMRWVSADELPKEPCFRKIYAKFAVVKNGRDGRPSRYGCPRNFNRLTMSWYLNDPRRGERPNVYCDEGYNFRAAWPIRAGEELTVDSNLYSDHRRGKIGSPKTVRKRGSD